MEELKPTEDGGEWRESGAALARRALLATYLFDGRVAVRAGLDRVCVAVASKIPLHSYRCVLPSTSREGEDEREAEPIARIGARRERTGGGGRDGPGASTGEGGIERQSGV